MISLTKEETDLLKETLEEAIDEWNDFIGDGGMPKKELVSYKKKVKVLRGIGRKLGAE